jgi:ParB family chromosome partitioning protein
MGHARALINMEDPAIQLVVYQNVLDNDLSVRKTEELVRQIQTQKPQKPRAKPKPSGEQAQLQAQLKRYFDVGVEFKRNSKGRGTIILSFSSDDELEKILGKLDGIKE